MVASRQSIPDWLTHAIGQQHRQIVSEHGVPNSRFHADTRGTARDDQMRDPQFPQAHIEVGLKEPAEPGLVDDVVASLWREFRNYVRVPGVTDQDSALP